MPLPSFVTQENVRFNGTLDNAVVLKNSGGIKSLILWDKLDKVDKAILTDIINAYGGTTPLAGNTAGSATADFKGTVVGGNATGLSSVGSTTAGKATIDLGGAATGSSTTGFATAKGGSQAVLFASTKIGSDSTGLYAGVTATSGYQAATFSVAKTGASATGLANDTTAYTATITVDGVAKPISVVGSAAQTFTTLLAEINTDLGASATATIVGGNIRVTSATTGATSTVLMVTGTLFSALTSFASITAAVQGISAVASTTYTATVKVDGTDRAISVVGSAAQTFTTLITEINADLSTYATAALVSGTIVITSATTGNLSKVSITPGTLFPALTGYSRVDSARRGVPSATAVKASILVVVDDHKKISIVADSSVQTTVTTLLTKLNTALGSFATAALTGGNIVITSATTGSSSTVRVYDNGMLSSLTGFTRVTTVDGGAARAYTATIKVDGVAKAISVVGSAAQTFTTLVSEINTDLASSATAAISGGNIVITSATTGASSSVVISDVDLFHSVTGFSSAGSSQSGATDLVKVFNNTRTPQGSLLSELFPIKRVGAKPPVPAHTPHSVKYVYYNGSVWKYLDDDTTV